MINSLTFKEYLKSKDELREAIKETPCHTIQYTVDKYCRLVVGESKEDKEIINLKPSQSITVEWLYEDIDNPIAQKITFDGVCSSIDMLEYSSYWQPHKLQLWLRKNASTKNPVF